MKTEVYYEKGDWVLYDHDSEKVLAVFDHKPSTVEVTDVLFRAQQGKQRRNIEAIEKLQGVINE